MTKELQTGQDTFTVSDSSAMSKRGEGFKGGRYVGKSPMQAAQKAAKKLFRLSKDKAAEYPHKFETVVFKLKRTTRGSERDERVYRAKKTRGGKQTMVSFKTASGTLQFPDSKNIVVELVNDESVLVDAIREAKH